MTWANANNSDPFHDIEEAIKLITSKRGIEYDRKIMYYATTTNIQTGAILYHKANYSRNVPEFFICHQDDFKQIHDALDSRIDFRPLRDYVFAPTITDIAMAQMLGDMKEFVEGMLK